MITAVEKVAAIRDAGYKVTVRHLRHVVPASDPGAPGMWLSVFEAPDDWVICGRGGRTIVRILVLADDKEIEIATGLALCSDEDVFERRKGFELATQRAIAKAPELRAVIGALASEKGAAAS